jgi:hypothetical protein
MSAAAEVPSAVETLERLRGLERAAAQCRDDARRNADAGAWERHREATRPLHEYANDVRFKRRHPDPAEAKRLSEAFIKRVDAEGMVFGVSSAGPLTGELILLDLHADAARDAAEAQHRAAQRARRDFEREHAEDLRVDHQRAEMDRIRRALAGNDPQAARAALS